MDIAKYFTDIHGTGILSTSNDEGIVNSAVYAVPHIMDEGLLAFIMRERRTHDNIGKNAHACYLFIEQGKMSGVRLYLTKVKEEKNSDLLFAIRKRCKEETCETKENLYLVYFKVDEVLPLIGPEN